MMRADDIHAALVDRWPDVLVTVGIGREYLKNKHGPCPVCGGKDRFRFDNRHRRGDFYCNGCGPGDGFRLVMRYLNCEFAAARVRVMEAAGLQEGGNKTHNNVISFSNPAPTPVEPSNPSRRVLDLLRSSCNVVDCEDARAYLDSRRLWPLPQQCELRAHPTVRYWDDGECLGRYPALIAPVRDIAGELVTTHVTYLQHGRKLADHEPRKLFSAFTGREGCAVRLMPLEGNTLGIAEGVETALSAARLHRIPTWAATNATMLEKFTPPSTIQHLIVFADNDVRGVVAAARLIEKHQGRIRVEIEVPPTSFKDFNDELIAQTRN